MSTSLSAYLETQTSSPSSRDLPRAKQQPNLLLAAYRLVEERVINSDHPGRTRADEITLFDGTGVGLQDLAVAAAAVEAALAAGAAVEVPF